MDGGHEVEHVAQILVERARLLVAEAAEAVVDRALRDGERDAAALRRAAAERVVVRLGERRHRLGQRVAEGSHRRREPLEPRRR